MPYNNLALVPLALFLLAPPAVAFLVGQLAYSLLRRRWHRGKVNGWLNVTFDRLSPALHLALVATIIASIAMVFLFPLL